MQEPLLSPLVGLGTARLHEYHFSSIGFTMTSPRTPQHSRHPSNIDLSFATSPSYGNESSPRRYSKNFIHSPAASQRNSLNRADSIGIDVFSSGGPAAASNGLGNLADELADAWDDGEGDEDENEPDMDFQEGVGPSGSTRHGGADITSSPAQAVSTSEILTPPTLTTRGHRRQNCEYDGSDYGEDSDLDSPGMPPGLQSRMDMVESLARRGTESNGTDSDGVVKRVIEGLKDLGGQSGVEGGASRFWLSCPFLKVSTNKG